MSFLRNKVKFFLMNGILISRNFDPYGGLIPGMIYLVEEDLN